MNQPAREKGIWDRRYAGRTVEKRAVYDPWLTRWETVLPSGGDALDIGCGVGLDTEMLLKKGYAVTAIDFSDQAVRLARRRNPAADVRRLNIDQLEMLDPNRYALVLANLTLHYLSREGLDRAFANIEHLLRPGGWFVFRLNASDDRNYGSPDDATSWGQVEVDGVMKQFFTEEKIRTVTEGRFDILSLEKMTTHRYGKPKQLMECIARKPSG